jgi:pimeloyl-ACP methyl ester carboxylesterase
VPLAVALCVAACTGPDHHELAARTRFALARNHGSYVEVNGLDTFAIVAGEGPDLILLHGDLSSTYTWRHLIEPLARGLRVHAIDLPGHGFSEKPANAPYTTTWLAGHVAAYMQATGVTSAVIVGSSMGAEVASEVAALYPRLTRGLVLIAPAGLPAEQSMAPRFAVRILRWPLVGEIVARLPFRARLAQLLHDAYYDPTRLTEEDIDAYYVPARSHNGLSAFVARVRRDANVDRTSIVRTIRAPTLIVVGEVDRLVPGSIAQRYRRLVVGSREEVIERTGHLPQEERPDAVLRVIEEWLGLGTG